MIKFYKVNSIYYAGYSLQAIKTHAYSDNNSSDRLTFTEVNQSSIPADATLIATDLTYEDARSLYA